MLLPKFFVLVPLAKGLELAIGQFLLNGLRPSYQKLSLFGDVDILEL
jgi:hypothetical protein